MAWHDNGERAAACRAASATNCLQGADQHLLLAGMGAGGNENGAAGNRVAQNLKSGFIGGRRRGIELQVAANGDGGGAEGFKPVTVIG